MAHIEINRIESVLSFAREAILAKHGHALPYRMAMTAGLAFCQHRRRAFSILPRENTGYPLEQQFNLCERSRSSCHLLALNTRRGLGAWIASSVFRPALFTANTC